MGACLKQLTTRQTRFSCISHYVQIHRRKDVKHASIKHTPDLPVYGVTNFAFVDDCPHLGCKQSLAACAASVEGGYGIPCSPTWRRPGVDSSDGQLSGFRNGQAMVEPGKPEPARTVVVSSVFAADIPTARRALPRPKTRGPLPSAPSLRLI